MTEQQGRGFGKYPILFRLTIVSKSTCRVDRCTMANLWFSRNDAVVANMNAVSNADIAAHTDVVSNTNVVSDMNVVSNMNAVSDMSIAAHIDIVSNANVVSDKNTSCNRSSDPTAASDTSRLTVTDTSAGSTVGEMLVEDEILIML
jgi:hypothetical protein